MLCRGVLLLESVVRLGACVGDVGNVHFLLLLQSDLISIICNHARESFQKLSEGSFER